MPIAPNAKLLLASFPLRGVEGLQAARSVRQQCWVESREGKLERVALMVDTFRRRPGARGSEIPHFLLKVVSILGILAIISLSTACAGTNSPPPASSSAPESGSNPATPDAATASPEATAASDSVEIFQSNTNTQDGGNCQQSSTKSTVTSSGTDGVEQSSEISQSNINNQVIGNCINEDCSQINVQGNAATVTQSSSYESNDGANVSSSHQSVTSTQSC